jgi:hypothetical protein
MHRWIAILLLALLPLHLSWAAVAPYCGHEMAPQTQEHFGHHDHTAPISAPTADDADAAADIAQPDCGQCHNHCTGVLVAPAIAQSVGIADIVTARASASASDQMPAPPERPQWARLA